MDAYFADKVHVTDGNYRPVQQRRRSPSASEREAMFWEMVDQFPTETSLREGNNPVEN